MCEHEWEYEKNWKENLEFGSFGETIEIPQKCSKCGKRAKEIWIYSCVVELR